MTKISLTELTDSLYMPASVSSGHLLYGYDHGPNKMLSRPVEESVARGLILFENPDPALLSELPDDDFRNAFFEQFALFTNIIENDEFDNPEIAGNLIITARGRGIISYADPRLEVSDISDTAGDFLGSLGKTEPARFPEAEIAIAAASKVVNNLCLVSHELRGNIEKSF